MYSWDACKPVGLLRNIGDGVSSKTAHVPSNVARPRCRFTSGPLWVTYSIIVLVPCPYTAPS